MAKDELITDFRFGYSKYNLNKSGLLHDNKVQSEMSTYSNLKDFASRGLSWNISFLDNILRSEFYVENAIKWTITKALRNGIDLNIRDIDVDNEKVIGVKDDLNKKYLKPLLDFGILGRGYGGSGALITINGSTDKDELLKPLNYTKDIKKDDVMTIRPLTRLYQILPDYSMGNKKFISNIGTETGIYDDTELGKPQYYRVSISGGMYNKGTNGKQASFDNFVNTFVVHRSRLLIYNSSKLSWIEEQVEQYFGISLAERAIEQIKAYKKSLDEIMKLLTRSNIPVANFANLSGVGRTGELGLSKIDDLIEAYEYALASGDLVVLGAKDEEDLKFLQADFKEITNILLDRKKELSAALEAPLTVTFKEKDDLDEKEHYSSIEEIQERQYGPALKQLIPIIYKIKYGEDIPEWSFNFRTLETSTEKEKIDKLKVASDIVNDLFLNNLINVNESRQMLISANENVGDMFHELSKLKDIENGKKYSNDFQIELANELNWKNKSDDLNKDDKKGYNMVESKLKGKTQGGNQKRTKKPGLDI